VERPDGSAHLSALLRRASASDRWLQLELELGGLLAPGAPGYPPAGALAGTLLAAAYAPLGPVDPAAFRFYPAGTGTLRGLGAYAGALLSLQVQAPLQAGIGASDCNANPGLGGTFAVAVQSQPQFETLAPAGDAELTAAALPFAPLCASHVDRDDAAGTGPPR